MVINYTLKLSSERRKPLTPEQIAEIESKAPRDEEIVYDKDCPPMTDEQLKHFKPVNPHLFSQAQ